MTSTLRLAVLLSLFAGCSITHRSGEFACGAGNTCPQGRICIDGFCVIPGAVDDGGLVDARKPDGGGHGAPDAGSGDCPAQCTSCQATANTRTCIIDCKLDTTECAKAITCPSGFNCDVQCTTSNSCRNGVACPENGACNVTCSGQSSCQNISCGAGPCDVTCSGGESCRTVGCNNSCACDITCGDASRCEGITCSSFQCDTFNSDTGAMECSSTQNPLCNTCP